MRYRGIVIRPPSEADSYILQVAYGCSHNRCTFCGTYLDKPFHIRPIEEVLGDIDLARSQLPDTRRVFLADGNALVLDTQRLVSVLDALGSGFPLLRRVGTYASARDILGKTDADLAASSSENWRSSTWAWRAGAMRFFAEPVKGSRRPRWWRPSGS